MMWCSFASLRVRGEPCSHAEPGGAGPRCLPAAPLLPRPRGFAPAEGLSVARA